MSYPLTNRHEVGLTLDWKGFDTTIPPFLIKHAFEVVWSCYDFSSKGERYQKYFRTVFDFLIEYFINTPIMLSDGRVFKKSHGIPSGSSFT